MSRHRWTTCRSPRRERGIAMLVAILLVALGTIVAAAVAYESAMSARRSIATFSFDEALLVAQGAEALAGYGLRASAQMAQTKREFYPGLPYSQPVGPLEVVPGVTLEASLEDMQGRFNLNTLIDTSTPGSNKPDPDAVKAFTYLLDQLGIEPKWADLLADWIRTGTQALPDGAKDSTYLSQNPPYLTANRFITSTSELLALPGFGRDRFVKLAPFVAALPPGSWKLNICAASALVLNAYLGHQDFNPESLASNRANANRCFPNLNDYQATFESKNDFTRLSSKFFGTQSAYFRLSSLVTIGTAEFNLYSLLYMDGFTPPRIFPVIRTYTAD